MPKGNLLATPCRQKWQLLREARAETGNLMVILEFMLMRQPEPGRCLMTAVM